MLLPGLCLPGHLSESPRCWRASVSDLQELTEGRPPVLVTSDCPVGIFCYVRYQTVELGLMRNTAQ
jgi:hypothetical protein